MTVRDTPARPTSRYRREHILLALCITLLLLATIPPLINLGRYQHRIATAISRSIGRQITLGSVSLRLIPWPAIEVANLTVAEDPAFGAEPALQAPEVVIEPRLWSLWRGRFELSRVELTDASVNLVRNASGRWSIGSILLQASHVSNAPTGQAHAGMAPRFPYIEATGTRINVKQGAEKLPYSLLDADFSMWLARRDVWGIKLEGQPVRTDLALSLDDTGTLRLHGELHRASAMGTMPLSLQGSWEHAPVGELGHLLLGRDTGWRGELDASAQFTGEIDHLQFQTRVVVNNLHHQEFTPGSPFTVDARCRGQYSRSSPLLDAFSCRWPLGTGGFVLEHEARWPHGALALHADRIPATVLADAVHLLRAGGPPADRFHGEMSGDLSWNPEERSFAGTMQIPVLSIAGAGLNGNPLRIENLTASPAAAPSLSLLVSAEPLPMGMSGDPLALGAELGPHQVTVHVAGGATMGALSSAAAALRVPFPANLLASGTVPATVRLALTASQPWLPGDAQGYGTHAVSGTLQFANVQWSPSWLARPVGLPSIEATLGPDSVRWDAPAALLGSGSNLLRLTGFVLMPRHCVAPAGCPSQFTLTAPTLNADALEAIFGSDQHLFSALLRRLDYTPPHFPAFTGELRAGLLNLGRLPVHDAAIDLVHASAGDANLTLRNLDGSTLGGTVHGSGVLNLDTESVARYKVHLTLAGLSVPSAAALWHENWGPGTVSGSAQVSANVPGTPNVLDSIQGSFHLVWQHGALGGVLPAFAVLDANGTLGPAGMQIQQGTFSGTPAALEGLIDWDKTLHLEYRETRAAAPERITGTLDAPETPDAEPRSP